MLGLEEARQPARDERKAEHVESGHAGSAKDDAKDFFMVAGRSVLTVANCGLGRLSVIPIGLFAGAVTGG